MTLYDPPIDEEELLLKWIRRARESQASHYDMADRLNRRARWLGVSVIGITSLIGTFVFLSLVTTAVSSALRLIVGMTSVVAAVLAALQTFLRYAGAARRANIEPRRAIWLEFFDELEAILRWRRYARLVGTIRMSVRDELDCIAEDVPNVPSAVFRRVQEDLMDAGRLTFTRSDMSNCGTVVGSGNRPYVARSAGSASSLVHISFLCVKMIQATTHS